MYRRIATFVAFLFLATLSLAEGEQQFADLGSCKVESGETIRECRIGYRTWGKLNPDKSNVVVLLTWFTGTSGQLAASVGEHKYVDPARYFVIAIDALADGVSSSPSNSTAQPRMQFPKITIADMVTSQHRLLSETLKLSHVHGIVGTSMGGMEAFQWAVQYPDFMDTVIPIVGSTQLTAHDLLLWRAEKNAILENRNWKNGNYQAPLRIDSIADIHHLELETPDRLNREMQPQEFKAKAAKVEEDESFDSSDRVRQLEAMMSQDISRHFHGSMPDAAQAVKARMLIVVADHDHMVNPHPALAFAELIHSTPIHLQSDCGHLAPGCEEVDKVTRAVGQALTIGSK